MSLAENEKRVRELSGKLVEPHRDVAIVPEVMEELLKRRSKLEKRSERTFTVEEMSGRVRAALEDVR